MARFVHIFRDRLGLDLGLGFDFDFDLDGFEI